MRINDVRIVRMRSFLKTAPTLAIEAGEAFGQNSIKNPWRPLYSEHGEGTFDE